MLGGARRLLLAALAFACVLTLPLAGSAAALADPDYPTAEAVEAAKQAAAAKNGEVGAIEAELKLADQKLEQLNLQTTLAIEAYVEAVYQLQLAEQQAAETAARAQEADVAVETARNELGRFASASYRMGGDLAALSALLDAKGVKGIEAEPSGQRLYCRRSGICPHSCVESDGVCGSVWRAVHSH